MHICMYVRMYVYVCMHVRMYECLYVGMYACMYVCMHAIRSRCIRIYKPLKLLAQRRQFGILFLLLPTHLEFETNDFLCVHARGREDVCVLWVRACVCEFNCVFVCAREYTFVLVCGCAVRVSVCVCKYI